MEEKKMPTWLVILLIVVGLCLVGFGIWYGVNYSKESEESPSNQTEEPSSSDIMHSDSPTSETSVDKKDCESIKKLDFSTNKTKFYCYADECSSNEQDLLEYYKQEHPSSNITSGFSDYILEIKNGEALITDTSRSFAPKEKNYKLEEVNNPKSIRVHFSVESGQEVYALNQNNELYVYIKYFNWSNENDENNGKYLISKLLYKNVKDFTVIEGNDYSYCSIIGESEGQNILVVLHTNDGKTLVGNYDKFSELK